MEVFTRVVISMETGEILEKDSYEYQGPVAECKGRSSGGGGQSGKVAYPDYIVTAHSGWITLMEGEVSSLPGLNPYSQAAAYDPEENLLAMQSASDVLNEHVATLAPSGDWSAYYSAAKVNADALLTDTTTAIDPLVDVYEDAIVDQTNRALTGFHGALYGANNMMSSTYVVGDALINSYASRDVNKFRAELMARRDADRTAFIQNGIAAMSAMLQLKTSATQSWAAMVVDMERMKIVAQKERYEGDLEYDVKDILWNVDVIQEASSILGAPGGAIPATRQLSKNQSALAGALSGAASGGMMGGLMAGASAGGMTGPQGAILGGVIGGIGGLLSG